MNRILILCVLLLPAVAAAASFPKSNPVPGGVAVLQLPDSKMRPMVHLGHERIMVVRHRDHWYALAGIPLSTQPGELVLEIKAAEAPALQLKFSVVPKQYAEQRLTIKNPQLVNPTPAELKRIEREHAHLLKVLDTWVAKSDPGLAFIWPAAGPQTSGFGLRRFLNGEARSPHSGIDIGAPAGTPGTASSRCARARGSRSRPSPGIEAAHRSRAPRAGRWRARSR